MNRPLTLALSTLLLSVPALSPAGDLTPEDLAFFNQRAPDLVSFEYQTVDDLAIDKVFAVPFYTVKITIKIGDGGQYSTHVVTRVGDTVVPVLRPGEDGDLPQFQKLLRPELRLRNNNDAKAVHQALNVLYPPFMDSEKKLLSFRRAGNSWLFVRGEFFESKSGFVFEVDASGEIKSVKYQLRLP
jgi:hypothetical protein